MKADAEQCLPSQGRVRVQEGLLPLQEEGPARRVELGRPPETVRQEQTGKCQKVAKPRTDDILYCNYSYLMLRQIRFASLFMAISLYMS